MRLLLNLFLLGWWLTRQRWMAEGQLYAPSISVNPSNVVAVGENISISCKSEWNQRITLTFILWKEFPTQTSYQISTDSNKAEFHIVNVQKSNSGTYRCTYKIFSAFSPYSSPAYIFVREQAFPSPSILVIPSEMVVLGEKATIQCKNEYYRAVVFNLIKKGTSDQPPSEHTEKKMAEFLIPSVQESDGGIYFCDYRFYYGSDNRYSRFSNRIYINITDPSASQPSIHVEPKGQHILNGNVSIYCQGPENDLNYSLYRSGDFIASQRTKPESFLAEFPIFGVKLEDTGNYSCRYHLRRNPFVWSNLSDPVQLEVRDPSLIKPSIQIISEEQDALGANISIRCKGTKPDPAFALLRSREQVAYKTAAPDKNSVDFFLYRVRLEKPQSYTCQYHSKSSPFVWSEPSDPLQLPSGAGFSIILWAATAAVLFLLAILILVLILYRKRRKGSATKERNLPAKMLSEPAAEEAPDEVSYAAINHNSLKTRSTTLPYTAPESCIYAAVSENKTKEIQ